METNIIWLRHGLRVHDNPALLEALSGSTNAVQLLPIFIFDGESAGTKSVGYNRMQFLLKSLDDLNERFKAFGGRLYLFQGKPTTIFRLLHEHLSITKICYEQDCEPIWRERDNAVLDFCNEHRILNIEKVSHTLWDPRVVIDTNGGVAPLTYQMFLHTIQMIGLPPRPVSTPDLERVHFAELPEDLLTQLQTFEQVPRPEDFNIFPENIGYVAKIQWQGGETEALELLQQRLKVEGNAFLKGCYLPNQANPNILESPKSMSAHLRFGCLSVRRFYWDIHDLFGRVQQSCGFDLPSGSYITGQLIWREYFYTMSVNNPNYDHMNGNEICLSIPWAKACEKQLFKWKTGKTGFPLIDAAMRQLLVEGWQHHCLRNTVATFLTRGGLWQNWEHGLQHFLKFLLDADWSVCAGNWMWVSSSAFEKMLDSSLCTCPIALGKRLDPRGDYIKQYVPELCNVPKEYIHEPWKMPQSIQEEVECIIGFHYSARMIDLEAASKHNNLAMTGLRDALIAGGAPKDGPPHCRPSNEQEIRHFFWLE